MLIELTPGPNMGYLALVSVRWGVRAGLTTLVGVTGGLAVYMIAAVAGVSEVALREPLLYQALRWAGVAFLLWLAWEAWCDGDAIGTEAKASPGGRGLAIRGFLANILNPKAALFYIVLLPGFTNPALGSVAGQSLALGLIHLFLSVAIHLGVILTAGSAHATLGRKSVGQTILVRRGFAIALVLVAVWLVITTGRIPVLAGAQAG